MDLKDQSGHDGAAANRDVTINMVALEAGDTFTSERSTPEDSSTEIVQKDDRSSWAGSDFMSRGMKAKSSSGMSSGSINFWEHYTNFKPEDVKAFDHDDEDEKSGVAAYVSDTVSRSSWFLAS